MILKKNQNIKLWLLMIAAVVLWTIGTGFFYDLSATSEETYEGLKVFSDVIELIEKEYVDEVDAKELIENAIQGMVQSLDPHSSLLPQEAFEDLPFAVQSLQIPIQWYCSPSRIHGCIQKNRCGLLSTSFP